MVERGPPELPDARARWCSSATPDWDELRGRAPATSRGARPSALPRRRRPDQHPVHLAAPPGFPKGATLSPPQHPQQRLLRRRGLRLHRAATGSASPCPSTTASAWCMGNLGCTTHGATHGDPGARPSTRRRRCAAVAGTSAARRSTACRRCSSPSSSHPDFADATTCRRLRTGIMAGSPCPVEVMKQVVDDMHMDRGDDLLRHDRDLAGRRRRPAPTTPRAARRAPSAACIPTSRSRSSTRRPATSLDRGEPASCCTRGYSVMLGYWNEPRRPPRPIDAGGWMHTGDLADDGRRRLPRTSSAASRTWSSAAARTSTRARSRSSSTPTPTSPTSQVVGVPDEQLRRGADGLDPVRRGRAPLDAEDAVGVLRRAASPTTRSRATSHARRRVPDDRHRQGAEVQDARHRPIELLGLRRRRDHDWREAAAARRRCRVVAGVLRRRRWRPPAIGPRVPTIEGDPARHQGRPATTWPPATSSSTAAGPDPSALLPERPDPAGQRHAVITWGNGGFEHPRRVRAAAAPGVVGLHRRGGGDRLGRRPLRELPRRGRPHSTWPATPTRPAVLRARRHRHVAAVGRSRGAGGSVRATTTTPGASTHDGRAGRPAGELFELLGANHDYDPARIRVPTFFMRGEADTIISPIGAVTRFYGQVPGAAAMAILKGADHNTVQIDGGGFRGYLTAWLRWQLAGDGVAAGAFVGPSPELLSNRCVASAAGRGVDRGPSAPEGAHVVDPDHVDDDRRRRGRRRPGPQQRRPRWRPADDRRGLGLLAARRRLAAGRRRPGHVARRGLL